MMATAGDATDVVERALVQCEASFIHGVHSFHGGHQSDLLIRRDAFHGLKQAMLQSFENRLGGDDGAERWAADGERVRRVGFYAGALAAFHAYADFSEWVEQRHLERAMTHVKAHCNDPAKRRIAWVYCP